MYRKEKNANDVLYILEHLREEDKAEAKILRGSDYVVSILNDIMNSCDDIFVLGCKKSDDTPVCMGGCVPAKEQGTGIVWLLSTPEIERHQICFLRNAKDEFEKINKKYWLTYNFIFNQNFLAKKWLSKFGYSFESSQNKLLNIPDDFELFYKLRNTRGLNNGTNTAI